MKKEILERQWQTKFLFLSFWEKLIRSSLLIVLLTVNLIFINNAVFKGEELGMPLKIFQIFSFISVALFINWSIRSRKFKLIKTTLTENDFNILIKSTALDLGWNIEYLTPNYSICKQGHNWLRDGIRVTILRKNNVIALNSIVEPSFRSHPFSGISNRINYKTFEKNLLDLKSGTNILENSINAIKLKELKYLQEDEKSLKNTIRRIVLYTLSFSFATLGVLLLIEKMIVGFLLLFFSIGYIYLDIKALEEKVKLLKELKKDTNSHPSSASPDKGL